MIHSTGEKIQNLFIETAKLTLKVKNTKNVPKNWKKKKKSNKWFDSDCKNLQTEVRKAGRQKHSSPHNNLLREKYHEKLKEYKKTTKSKKYIYIQDALNEINSALEQNDSLSFWKKWENFGENDANKSQLKIPGQKLYDHFSKLHSQSSDAQVPEMESPPNKIIDTERLNRPFSNKEFKNVINSLKNKKAVGYDSISNEMIKHSPDIILNLINRFMNLCLEKSLIPNSCTYELISLIHKKGDERDLANYRGICVSSALLKILCSLLNTRIQVLCAEYKVLNKNQIGFRKKCRTSDHILTLKNIVKKYVTIGKKKLYVCFVDFEKAFDSVWHKGLFKKLHDYGIHGNSLNLIIDLYAKTKCSIKSGNHITEFFNYEKGVRQGCPLSPLLFNLFINDLVGIINKNSNSNINLNTSNKINALLYADDLVLISESKEGLQRQIDTLQEYCQKWKLKINTDKTKTMVFNRGNKIINANFKVDNSPIENVKRFKYLGFTLSAKNCQFQPTIDDLGIKATRALFAIRKKMKLSKLPAKLAIKIFNSQIVPILLYGSEVWGPYMDVNFYTWDKTKIEQTQTQFLKQVLGCHITTSNIMARAETGCRPLLNQIIKRYILYYKHLKENTSNLSHDAFIYETENRDMQNTCDIPNFSRFLERFNLNLEALIETDPTKFCNDAYDRLWQEQISDDSSKAISFCKFKTRIHLEPYLLHNLSHNQKIAISRFRLSNHSLMIEKGRHVKPKKIDRDKRYCYFCKNEVEDEQHFLLSCPLYTALREKLENSCRLNCINYNSLNPEQKFIFIMSNENGLILKTLGKFIVESMNLREKMLDYFFL